MFDFLCFVLHLRQTHHDFGWQFTGHRPKYWGNLNGETCICNKKRSNINEKENVKLIKESSSFEKLKYGNYSLQFSK